MLQNLDFLFSDVTVFWRLRPAFLYRIVVKVPAVKGGGGSFQRKVEARRFCGDVFPLPQMQIPCLLLPVASVSIPIRLHTLLPCSYPMDHLPAVSLIVLLFF